MITIRIASPDDLDRITALEAVCFPAAEAAPRERFLGRLSSHPNHFLLLFDEGRLVSCVNGMTTDEADLRDEMFADPSLYDEEGRWLMIFGVATDPGFRCRGYAGELLVRMIEKARAEGRAGAVLTCKERLIPYYSKFGFRNEGLSGSAHGGAVWYQMRICF